MDKTGKAGSKPILNHFIQVPAESFESMIFFYSKRNKSLLKFEVRSNTLFNSSSHPHILPKSLTHFIIFKPLENTRL